VLHLHLTVLSGMMILSFMKNFIGFPTAFMAIFAYLPLTAKLDMGQSQIIRVRMVIKAIAYGFVILFKKAGKVTFQTSYKKQGDDYLCKTSKHVSLLAINGKNVYIGRGDDLHANFYLKNALIQVCSSIRRTNRVELIVAFVITA